MLRRIKHIKVPKGIGWLLPGLEIKRWFVLILLGSTFITLGLLVVLNIGILSWVLDVVKATVNYIPNDLLAGILIAIGVIIFFLGWK